MHRAAVVENVVGFVADVVLHVAAAAVHAGLEALFEPGEDFFRRHAQDRVENRKPAAVRCADDELLDAVAAGAVDEEVQAGDDRFGAFERESLLAHERLVQHMLQGLGPQQILENDPFLLDGQGRLVPRRFHFLDQPAPDVLVLDVEELDADGSAIGFLERRDDLPQRRGRWFHRPAGREDRIEVRLGNPELPRRQLLVDVGPVAVQIVVQSARSRRRAD